MKIILVGSSGFIGSEVLRQLLAHPLITTIVLIRRKPLPDELWSPKIQQIILRNPEHDFAAWQPSPETQRWVEGAAGCIWCLGGRPQNFPSLEAFTKVTHGYTVKFHHFLSNSLPRPPPRFRFCYLSTAGADLSESKMLLGSSADHKKHVALKGRTEKSLFDLTLHENVAGRTSAWELYTFRPGTVLNARGQESKNGLVGAGRFLGRSPPKMELELLAAAMVDAAVRGYGEDGLSVFFEHREIVEKGEEGRVFVKEEQAKVEMERVKKEREEEQRKRTLGRNGTLHTLARTGTSKSRWG